MPVVIRKAGIEHLPSILTLHAQLNPDDPIPDAEMAVAAWHRILGSSLITVHIAELDGAAIASCVVVIVPNLTRNLRPFALIENVVADARFRGQGLGKRVIGAAIEQAWSAGCYKVMLQTGRKDAAVHGFYESCGFSRGKAAFEIRPPAAHSPI
ncbi:GNAT family N-acetyltransferase [Bosea sp. BIWAKO-01]|uniref:GNAT family N-acetyltransferase n=1 Tax=Bosea sp. BIWAKO-01 TaxID=506668 RepID=UPI000853E9E9|nr:GNAT family N-acetyltransferase [Bosea sp. BIWAKO-01]GAU83695.1 acetyltransferase [Bosea sp. BIWAKO-01]